VAKLNEKYIIKENRANENGIETVFCSDDDIFSIFAR
jgi:hypothetical protein